MSLVKYRNARSYETLQVRQQSIPLIFFSFHSLNYTFKNIYLLYTFHVLNKNQENYLVYPINSFDIFFTVHYSDVSFL